MAVPKKKTSYSRKGMRRSHHSLKLVTNVRECLNCGQVKLSHHVCRSCGYYRNRCIINLDSKK